MPPHRVLAYKNNEEGVVTNVRETENKPAKDEKTKHPVTSRRKESTKSLPEEGRSRGTGPKKDPGQRVDRSSPDRRNSPTILAEEALSESQQAPAARSGPALAR